MFFFFKISNSWNDNLLRDFPRSVNSTRVEDEIVGLFDSRDFVKKGT